MGEWLEIANEEDENATAAAAIQIILECLDRSFGGRGIFRLPHETVNLRTFDWVKYFDSIVNQCRSVQFDIAIQCEFAETIGVMIAKFTENTEDVGWLEILAKFMRVMVQAGEIVQLIVQVPVYLLFELSIILSEQLPDNVRRVVEKIMNHVINTVEVHMVNFVARIQFATTFYNRLVHNLEAMDISRLSRIIVLFITYQNDKLDKLALSHIFSMLNAQQNGYEQLVAICCTHEFIVALNEILEKRATVTVLRLAFRIAILIQK